MGKKKQKKAVKTDREVKVKTDAEVKVEPTAEVKVEPTAEVKVEPTAEVKVEPKVEPDHVIKDHDTIAADKIVTDAPPIADLSEQYYPKNNVRITLSLTSTDPNPIIYTLFEDISPKVYFEKVKLLLNLWSVTGITYAFDGNTLPDINYWYKTICKHMGHPINTPPPLPDAEYLSLDKIIVHDGTTFKEIHFETTRDLYSE